jgi:hypothetical protein
MAQPAANPRMLINPNEILPAPERHFTPILTAILEIEGKK